MKNSVQLFKLVFDFLDTLSEEELKLLSEKKIKLKLDKEVNNPTETNQPKPKAKKNAKTSISVEEVCERIEGSASREEAMEYISGLSCKKNDLTDIAKKYNINVGSRDTKAQITEKIVESVVGSKLRFNALLNTELN